MEDWTYPYDTHYHTLNDSLKIAYVEEGQGEQTLIFIHGLGSYLKAWTKLIEPLKKDFHCIAIDLPAYGKSSKGDYPQTMSFFAATLLDFIDQKELNNITLIGHSMGGQIAMTTALQQSAAFEKMILLAPAGFEVFTVEEVKWFEKVYTPNVILNATTEQIVRNFHLNFYQFPEDAQFMIDDRLAFRDTIAFVEYANMIPRCVDGMLNEPVFGQLNKISTPVLILFGLEDLLIPNRILHPSLSIEEVAKTGAMKMPNATVELLPSCGHFVPWECVEIVEEKILSFMNK